MSIYLEQDGGGNYEDSLTYYFDESDKPNLVILGTSPGSENKEEKTFEEMVSFVTTNYPQYDFFYKGHPAYPSSDERKEFLAKNNIKELPSSSPAEIMLLFYQDMYAAGYLTTTFININADQVKYVFSTEENKNNTSWVQDSPNFDNSIFIVDELNKISN